MPAGDAVPEDSRPSGGLTTRAIAIVTIVVVALCLASLWAGLFIGEIQETHRIIRKVLFIRLIGRRAMLPDDAIRRLGGRERAARRLSTYLRLPAWVAPCKRTAVSLLGYCGAPAVPALLRVLRREDPELHLAAILGLRRIGPAAKDAVPALKSALRDNNEAVRKAAAAALKSIRGGQ